jgi:hypothetical protein
MNSYARCPSVGYTNDEREEEEPPCFYILQAFDKLIAVPRLGLHGLLELIRTQRRELSLRVREKAGSLRRVG